VLTELPGVGWVGPLSRGIDGRQRSFSVRQTDLAHDSGSGGRRIAASVALIKSYGRLGQLESDGARVPNHASANNDQLQ
jgi:hypothetical protein